MNAAYLLILLTFNAADQAGLSLVSTETLEECQLKGQALAGILSTSGIEVRENRCIESDMQFSKYRHYQTGGKNTLFTYKVEFKPDTVKIRLIPEGQVCEADKKGSYCATSTQKRVN